MARKHLRERVIREIPLKYRAAVAARNVMRALPLLSFAARTLGTRELSRLIFVTFRCCQCAAIYPVAADAAIYASHVAHAAHAASVAAYTASNAGAASHVAHAASVAAHAAATAAASASYINASSTGDALRVGVHPDDAAADAMDALEWDLAFIGNKTGLLDQPLWPVQRSMPDSLKAIWMRLRDLMSRLQYWIHWYEARLQGEPLEWAKIRDQILLPHEILIQEPTTINAYLLKLAHHQAVRPLNRVRVILIGPGESGKTSLLRALHGEPVVEGKEDRTVGIEIRESCFIPGSQSYVPAAASTGETVVHFWDFGGQVMYHATHQFFLRSNCVYVLVLDGRRAAAGGSEADYWLEHVRAFALGAPVLMVGNKADCGLMDWDANRLRRKYPNILPNGFYQLACTELTDPNSRYRHDFARFKEDLYEVLGQQVGIVQQKFTEAEFTVLNELRRRSPRETFLPKAEYERLCADNGLQDTRVEAELLDLLDKLGVVIHFPHIPKLDGFLLNPRWLTYGVYQLIDRQGPRITEAEAYECLSRTQLTDNLDNRLDYPRNRCGFILDAMERFQVAYPLPRGERGGTLTYVIPSLLPTEEPTIDFPEVEARAFRFRFEGILPPQLLPQMIVARHFDIDQGLVWRHGVLLRTEHSGGAKALLRGDAYDRTLTLWVTGQGLDRYFSVLYHNVKDILTTTMPELPYEELIRLPTAAQCEEESVPVSPDGIGSWVRWKNVLYASQEGDTVYREEGVKYDLNKVLGIMPKGARKTWEAELRRPANYTFINMENAKVGNTRDTYYNQGQAAAFGRKATAEGNTFQQVMLQLGNANAFALADELAKLRVALRKEAAEPEHDEALGAIAAAERSARQQDGSGLLKHLKSAGQWAFDVATKIGTSVAAKAIEQAMRL